MIQDDGHNSLVMPRDAWARLSRELRTLASTLERLRSPNPDQRRLGLVCLTGHEAEMVRSLSLTAAVVGEAPAEVSPMVLL